MFNTHLCSATLPTRECTCSLLPGGSIRPSPAFCHWATPLCKDLSFFHVGTQWGSPAPCGLIPTPGTPWFVLRLPICITLLSGFLMLEEKQTMSAFHATRVKLVLLKKFYRKGVKMTICQLSKHQCHSLTLAPGASITVLLVWEAFLGGALQS